jgi:cytochrome c biogenesis protein CcdA
MNESRLMQQMTAIFSVFMVFFYIGVGAFFIFYSDRSTIDKPVRIILGSTFIFYGLYRAFRAYLKIVEAFFKKDNNRDKRGDGNSYL